ncbi:VanZ family protein [Marinicella sp. S1101]|uniref:VanZ family protein n=1 Tax=Marinicella marina TaxID=2996016 RepID=UPI00226096D0|nr:VanZ family protein [Marinicella marina]MCX7553293.1 VanZ family protein [Marinicella marina]MDJ1139025.1 VanZ family protein [Marinicella marina]
MLSKKNWIKLIAWLMTVALVVLSLIKLPQPQTQIPHSDKWLHLSSYCFLAYWFYHAYHAFKYRITAGLIALGIGLEWLQALTPHRYFEWLDMLMNVTGVLLAWLLYHGLKLRLKTLLD